jgi:hypothetical protein
MGISAGRAKAASAAKTSIAARKSRANRADARQNESASINAFVRVQLPLLASRCGVVEPLPMLFE